jgi:putative addiction module component (TIGR02574 family)
MASQSMNIAHMSVTEKIGLMERLWESLSASGGVTEPPEWHAVVLNEREAEWQNRQVASQDWEQAKEEIRKQSR